MKFFKIIIIIIIIIIYWILIPACAEFQVWFRKLHILNNKLVVTIIMVPLISNRSSHSQADSIQN